jgi:hypothetical protein
LATSASTTSGEAAPVSPVESAVRSKLPDWVGERPWKVARPFWALWVAVPFSVSPPSVIELLADSRRLPN